MPSYSKRKGSDFEREAVNVLTNLIDESVWKRIPTSGAIGTRLAMPILQSDLLGRVSGFPQEFRGEAKCGYGGAKQVTVMKEWLDKIYEEAKSTFSLPFLIGKFSGARGGTNVFVVLDVRVFADLVNRITDLQRRLDEQVREQDVGRNTD